MKFFSSWADALNGAPVRLGGDCRWEITSLVRDGKTVVSAGLKDDNGCTLRTVSGEGKVLSPALALVNDGKVLNRQKMGFG